MVRRPLRLMFQGEARFGRISEPRRCWAPLPLRPSVACAVVREFTYAAVSPGDGKLDSLVLPEAGTRCMNLFPAELSCRYPAEQYRARPGLNPVEHLWDALWEKYFHNHLFASLQAVEDRLVEGLRQLEQSPGSVHSITGWP